MGNDLSNIGNFFAPEKSKKLKEKQSEIEKLAASDDGAKVSSILSECGAADALQRGDTAALKNALENILKTDEGSRLCRQLSDMFK